MNIDFSRILPNRSLSGLEVKSNVEGNKVSENGVKSLFSDALTIFCLILGG